MIKPMLACSTQPDLDKDVKYPVMVSRKFDGVRAIAWYGKAYSRTGKLIPNTAVQKYFEQHNLHNLDGELMLSCSADFNTVQSVMMSNYGDASEFVYKVYELPSSSGSTAVHRYNELLRVSMPERCHLVEQHIADDSEEVAELYDTALDQGYEGVILKAPSKPYKHGRSTLLQGTMLKLKPFVDCEGTIVGFVELMHNDDTSCNLKENQVPGDTLGAFVVSMNGVQFNIGTGLGLTQELRKQYWLQKDELVGAQITFKHLGLHATGIPRCPSFRGIRYERV